MASNKGLRQAIVYARGVAYETEGLAKPGSREATRANLLGLILDTILKTMDDEA